MAAVLDRMAAMNISEFLVWVDVVFQKLILSAVVYEMHL